MTNENKAVCLTKPGRPPYNTTSEHIPENFSLEENVMETRSYTPEHLCDEYVPNSELAVYTAIRCFTPEHIIDEKISKTLPCITPIHSHDEIIPKNSVSETITADPSPVKSHTKLTKHKNISNTLWESIAAILGVIFAQAIIACALIINPLSENGKAIAHILFTIVCACGVGFVIRGVYTTVWVLSYNHENDDIAPGISIMIVGFLLIASRIIFNILGLI